MKKRIYVIDGKYGRVEFNILEEQKGKDTTYDWCEYDRIGDSVINQSEDFIAGLPEGITKDDYFRMALLSVLRSLKNSSYMIGNSLKDVGKEIDSLKGQMQVLKSEMALKKSKIDE